MARNKPWICCWLALIACEQDKSAATSPTPPSASQATPRAVAPAPAPAPKPAPRPASCEFRLEREKEKGQVHAGWLAFWRELPAPEGSEDEPPPTTDWEARTMLCGKKCQQPGAYVLCSGCKGDESAMDAPLSRGKDSCSHYIVLADPASRLLVFEAQAPCVTRDRCSPRLFLSVRAGDLVQATARVERGGPGCGPVSHERRDWFIDPDVEQRVLAVEQAPRPPGELAEVVAEPGAVRVRGTGCLSLVRFDEAEL